MTDNTADMSAMASALATILSGEGASAAPASQSLTNADTARSSAPDTPVEPTATVAETDIDADIDPDNDAGAGDDTDADPSIGASAGDADDADTAAAEAGNLASVAGVAHDQLEPSDPSAAAPAAVGDDMEASAPSNEKDAANVPDTTSIFAGFPAAPFQKGEIRLPLSSLVIGRGPARAYDFDAGAGEALLHAALDPDAIEPVVVTEAGETWPVIDGWARVKALRRQFGDTANVMVRAVIWDGSVRDALYKRFAAVFLTVNSRKIDRSTLLAEFHASWAVPQQVLAARIGWIESRVTKELAAARAFAEAPEFVQLHVKESDPPIDYLYKVQQAREAAAKEDAEHPKRSAEKGAGARLKAKLEALLARPERFATAQALAKLGIGPVPKAKPATGQSTAVSPALGDLEIVDSVDGADGEPIAIIETTPDHQLSIRLVVDVATMDGGQKEEARTRLREAIDKLLG